MKITEKIDVATELAQGIMINHNENSAGDINDWPEEPCHVCEEDSGHNVDHYSTHIATGDYEDPRFLELLVGMGPYYISSCDSCNSRADNWLDFKVRSYDEDPRWEENL